MELTGAASARNFGRWGRVAESWRRGAVDQPFLEVQELSCCHHFLSKLMLCCLAPPFVAEQLVAIHRRP
ncbi:hypothetical protein CRG98_029737 [Punica granatum]|uniref:Uncharacterized protein n=1 Tax=Punica granatum TaxID=22663 RepID=A0A2I0J0U5_PUNGR|nr:hypothetical protein CRG98_029737 [Punica granatum]